MMTLNTQINLIVFSLIFGMLFSLFITINYKFLFQAKCVFRFIINLMIIIISVLVYFIGIRKINSGILHIYSILLIIIGFIFDNFIRNKLIKKHRNL